MAASMTSRARPPATWVSYREALQMFAQGVTAPSAARIAVVVGTWLSLVNHGDLLLHGTVPWPKIALDYATPFMVASAGFLAARRRSNVERLARLLEEERPSSGSTS
jgi:hypothetical protein